jgi:hypothetical protein
VGLTPPRVPPTQIPDPPFAYSTGFPDNALVEIMHTCCDGNQNGYFSYLAKGSGIFVDLGRTKVFVDHMPAFAFFGARSGPSPASSAAARPPMHPLLRRVAPL